MANLARALVGLAAVVFVLAVASNFTGDVLITAEGFARACTKPRVRLGALLRGQATVREGSIASTFAKRQGAALSARPSCNTE